MSRKLISLGSGVSNSYPAAISNRTWPNENYYFQISVNYKYGIIDANYVKKSFYQNKQHQLQRNHPIQNYHS